MKRSLIVLLLALVLSATAGAQVKYSTYTNARFGYSIEYPSSLLAMQRAPENDDGRTFRSKDGSVEMRVWGSYNVVFATLDEAYQNAIKVLDGRPTYSKVGERNYAFSGFEAGKIYYERLFVVSGADGDTHLTFTIEYPKSQKAKWDPMVTRVARSFKSIAVGK